MIRVNINELDDEYNQAGSLIMMWEGQPFTGTAFQMSPQSTLWCEQAYVEGILDGVSKDWHLNGQLRSQTDYKWNRIHGHNREWFDNGQVKYDAIAELGTVIKEREWDEKGSIIKDYQLESDSWTAKHLESQRELFKNAGVYYQSIV